MFGSSPCKEENVKQSQMNIQIFLTKSKRRPIKLESDRGGDWFISIFQNFLKNIYYIQNSQDLAW